MSDDLKPKEEDNNVNDKIIRNQNRVYLNFDIFSVSDPKGNNKGVFWLMIILIALLGGYLVSFYV